MASFSSTLPPDDGTRRRVAPPPATGNGVPETSFLRVFLVEDSASVRERLTDFLSEVGEVEMTGFAETEADALRQGATAIGGSFVAGGGPTGFSLMLTLPAAC